MGVFCIFKKKKKNSPLSLHGSHFFFFFFLAGGCIFPLHKLITWIESLLFPSDAIRIYLWASDSLRKSWANASSYTLWALIGSWRRHHFLNAPSFLDSGLTAIRLTAIQDWAHDTCMFTAKGAEAERNLIGGKSSRSRTDPVNGGARIWTWICLKAWAASKHVKSTEKGFHEAGAYRGNPRVVPKS